MINIEKEKSMTLTTQEVYSILDLATQAANDEGFINSYVYERAVYLFAAIVLYSDKADEITDYIAESPLNAWDTLLSDGTVESLSSDFPQDMEVLAETAANWYEEYATYAHSARGLLSTLGELSENLLRASTDQLTQAQEDPNIQAALQIAEDWGMNIKSPTQTEE